MHLALEAMALKLNEGKKVRLSTKQKALLLTALYQACFMDRVPLHAIVNETVQLAKEHGLQAIAPFFNALLRKLEKGIPPLTRQERLSLPESFIQKAISIWGEEAAFSLLEMANNPSPFFARQRPSTTCIPFNPEQLLSIAENPLYYIQNPTPALLMEALAPTTSTPKAILDLCAAPGGKLLLAHDLFPQAALYANDSSAERMKTLVENAKKYGLFLHTRVGTGETYPQEKPFDLIIIDAPCSNSGVLYKRPEARLRLNQKQMAILQEEQLALLDRAASLLSVQGVIWYMTCSILPEENEELMARSNLDILLQKTQLPTKDGLDGGFGAALAPRNGSTQKPVT